MRPLVYTMCYGAAYLPVFRVWLESLRGAGRYAGDVVVLTDLPAERFASALRRPTDAVRAHPIRPERRPSPYYEKTAILELAELDAYDVVLYLDGDVVTVNPVDAVLDACRRADGPLLNRSRHDMAWEPNGGLLDERERARVERERIAGINAGVFGARRGVIAPFLARWRSAIETHHAQGGSVPHSGDQPFLNRMALRGEIEGCFLPDGWLQDWLRDFGWRAIRDLRAGELKLVHLPGPYTAAQKAQTMQRVAGRAAHAKAWYGYLTHDRLWPHLGLEREPAIGSG